ncbi:Uncharacterized protein Fot_05294 [Forsythia ovata]|uniref:Uncharacterized protein n=1 Tax=Forsythia ovata TaxID=205694 RepID=A0ABD1WTP5_9LAMI
METEKFVGILLHESISSLQATWKRKGASQGRVEQIFRVVNYFVANHFCLKRLALASLHKGGAKTPDPRMSRRSHLAHFAPMHWGGFRAGHGPTDQYQRPRKSCPPAEVSAGGAIQDQTIIDLGLPTYWCQQKNYYPQTALYIGFDMAIVSNIPTIA